MRLQAILFAVAAVVALGMGAFVGSRSPRRLANLSFAAGMAALAIVQVGYAMVFGSAYEAMGAQLSATAHVAMLPAWAVFGVTFAAADPLGQIRRWFWPVGLLTAGSTGLLVASISQPFVLVREVAVDGHLLTLTFPGKGAAVLGLLASVFVIFQLESALRNSSGGARWAIKYFVLALFGLFGVHIFVLSHQVLYSAIVPDHLVLETVVVLLAAGLMTASLVRHRLLDVDVFVSRHVVYRSVAIGAVGLYLLGLGLTSEVLTHFGLALDFVLAALLIVVTAIGLLAGLLSERVQQRVKHWIARHFYRHKYDYRREWSEFTAKVSAVDTAEAIPARIVERVRETLDIPRVGLWLLDEDRQWRLGGAVGLRRADRPLDFAPVGLRSGSADVRPLRVAQLRDVLPPPTLAVLDDLGLAVLVPLRMRAEVVGMLALGAADTSALSVEDEDLLSTIAAQAATVILNARLSEQLARSRELEAFHRLSSFVLHDLKNCVAMLSLVSQNAASHGGKPEFQRDAFRTVAESVRQMQELVGKLSGMPKQLDLVPRPTALDRVIAEVVARARGAAGERVQIATDLDPTAATVFGGDEALRSVVSNLVMNAIEASGESGRILVTTSRQGTTVTLAVSDTGCGMPEAFVRESLFMPLRSTKPRGLGIGLYQVKTLVEALAGRIRVETIEGSGTTFWVELPAGDREG